MQKLKVGIVGCGGIANGKHLPAMKATGYFDIVALLYYISITVVFIFLTVRVYEKRRWE